MGDAARGIPERRRVGNARADEAASVEAAGRAASFAWRARRRQVLQDFEACQRVTAAVELAALRANHLPGLRGGVRARR
eukprot:3886782-Lingulodinium_polyedra.AAC.1